MKKTQDETEELISGKIGISWGGTGGGWWAPN